MRTTYRNGPDAVDGGDDITIHLSPEEAALLGGTSGLMTEWFASALRGMVALRSAADGTATPTKDDWYWVINDLDNRLMPRLEAIRDAAIRAHHAAGGSVSHLALAMDAPRSTAQYRRSITLASAPSAMEHWATGGNSFDPTQ